MAQWWSDGGLQRPPSIKQCLQAVFLSFSINIPIFSVFCMQFHYFSAFYKELHHYYMTYVSNSPFFSKFYQYLWSVFSKNTDKSVYSNKMCCKQLAITRLHRFRANVRYCTNIRGDKSISMSQNRT